MKKSFLVFPLFYCLFPVLSLYASNVRELDIACLISPLLMTLAGTIVLWAVSGLITRSVYKGGILVSFLFFVFFSYTYLENLYCKFILHADSVIDPSGVFAVWVVILVGGVFLIVRYGDRLASAHTLLLIMSFGLIVMPAYRTISGQLSRMRYEHRLPSLSAASTRAESSTLPNIYYIILDGHARSDTLRDLYGLDNSKFLNSLRKQGFQVADRARSNYCQTILSLASSLNMEHVRTLMIGKKPAGVDDRFPLVLLIRRNRVFSTLEKHGYTTVAFETDYEFANAEGANVFIRNAKSTSSFDTLLLDLTPLRLMSENNPVFSGYEKHRKVVSTILGRLPSTLDIKQPVAVFAHILVPHPPFVFNSDGTPHNPRKPFGLSDGADFVKTRKSASEYREGYSNQVQFIDRKIEQVVHTILRESHRPTIIILQGDHGPASHLDFEHPKVTGLKERSRILCAVKVPAESKIAIPSDITPVNIFRIIFRRYFDSSLRTIDNHTYYSTFTHPYDLTDVTTIADGVGISVDQGKPVNVIK